MSTFKLSPGREFSMNSRDYILQYEFDGVWQVEDLQTHRINNINTSDLIHAYMSGLANFKVNYPFPAIENNKKVEPNFYSNDLSTRELTRVKIKKSFVEFHRNNFKGLRSKSHIEQSLNQFWNASEMGVMPSPSTAYLWIRRYSQSGDNLISLVNQIANRGNRTERLDSEISDLSDRAINEYYLKSTRPTIQGTLTFARTIIKKENQHRPASAHLKIPSYTYIRNKIEALDKYVIDKARYGKQYADMRYRPSIGSTPTNGLLSRAEVDHTPLDVEVKDDETGEVIGKPTITTVIDVETKCILGINISFETNSYARVVAALKHAIFPKFDLKEKYPSIKNEWECYGLMSLLVTDRGKEFIGKGLESLCLAFNIELLILPARRGDNKGSVERNQGTIGRMVTENLPGKTFSSVHVRGNGVNTRDKGCINFSTLKEIVFKTIVDIYHQKKHRNLGMSPIAKWRECLAESEIYLPISVDYFDAHCGLLEERVLSKTGIAMNSLIYNSIELGNLYKKIGGEKVRIRWNQEELGYIFVMLEPSGYLKVPVIPKLLRRALGKSLSQAKVVKRYEDANGISASDDELADRHDEIIELIKIDEKKSNKTTRVKAQRFKKNQLKNEKLVVKPDFISPVNEDILDDDIPDLERL